MMKFGVLFDASSLAGVLLDMSPHVLGVLEQGVKLVGWLLKLFIGYIVLFVLC